MNLKHLKLTNGDEIVCEVLDSNEEMAESVIRNAMRIVAIDDFENNVRYYTFKPWMSFQDDIEELVSLNSVHIIGGTEPSNTVLKHYSKAITEVNKYNALRRSDVLKDEDLDHMLDELSEEEMQDFIDKKYSELENGYGVEKEFDDSGTTQNIIQFNPKGTRHWPPLKTQLYYTIKRVIRKALMYKKWNLFSVLKKKDIPLL